MNTNTQQVILNDYIINKNTLALVSVAHEHYCTLALEGTDTFYINKPSLKIIEAACLHGGSTYHGRRMAAMHLTEAKRKVPIAINTHDCVYAIPTQSPQNHFCSWIFYNHIHQLKPNPKNSKTCTVTFNNGKQVQVSVSHQVMQKQLYRTAYCIQLFSRQHL